MQALAASAPQLGQAQPETLMQDSLPKPSAPPMAAESGAGLSSYPSVRQSSQGEPDGLQVPVLLGSGRGVKELLSKISISVLSRLHKVTMFVMQLPC